MTTAIELVTGPVSSVLSLSEVKAHLRISGSDEDTLLNNLIYAAEAHVDAEGDLGRAMVTQTWAQWEPPVPGWPRLTMTPFAALVSVEYYDTDGALQTATLANYETQKAGDFVRVKPKDGESWPATASRNDAIKITYTAGFGANGTDVPESIRQAMLMLIAHLYENREAASDVRITDVPMGYEMLMNNQRVRWYG